MVSLKTSVASLLIPKTSVHVHTCLWTPVMSFVQSASGSHGEKQLSKCCSMEAY